MIRIAPMPTSLTRRAALRAAALLLVALPALSGCKTAPDTNAPPLGSISADRVLGDILVRFNDPPVTASEDAGKLLGRIDGPIRFLVKRPMSGGVWLVTAISTAEDATLDQAVQTLRGTPRVAAADADRLLKPHRTMPVSRDMPAQ